MVRVKLCGMTNAADAQAAIQAGADYVGLIFTLESKRFISKGIAQKIIQAASDFMNFVGVFRNQPKQEIETFCEGLPIKIIQLHGEETPAFCNYFINRGFTIIKTFHMDQTFPSEAMQKYSKCHYYLLDSYDPHASGGTGKTFDWSFLKNQDLSKIFISGGLNDKNVGELIKQYQPFAVDAASGVEKCAGIKDRVLLQQFVQTVKGNG